MKEDEIFQFAQSSQVAWVLGHFRTLTNAELTTFDFSKAAGTYILFGTFDTIEWGGRFLW